MSNFWVAQVIVYVNTRNQASYFVEQEAADALLAFMHYLFARCCLIYHVQSPTNHFRDVLVRSFFCADCCQTSAPDLGHLLSGWHWNIFLGARAMEMAIRKGMIALIMCMYACP